MFNLVILGFVEHLAYWNENGSGHSTFKYLKDLGMIKVASRCILKVNLLLFVDAFNQLKHDVLRYNPKMVECEPGYSYTDLNDLGLVFFATLQERFNVNRAIHVPILGLQ